MRTNRPILNAAFATAIVAIFFSTSSQALACSRFAPFSFDELFVADVIVRATAGKYVREADPNMRTTGQPESEVEFRVEEVLRGKDVPKTLNLRAYLSNKDDYNDMPAPYTFVRKNGRSGSCFANTYRNGGEFLLFLRKTDDGYTPNISPLGPTNEQLRGRKDPWLLWARDEVLMRDK